MSNQTSSKIYLLTFGNTRNYGSSLQRIKREAEDCGWFDGVFACNENDLDTSFVARYGPYMNATPRGYGYWIWKPQIILQTLAKLQDGDVLWYLDCGCHIHPGGKQRFDEYNEMLRASSTDNIGFHLAVHLEKTWTKGDLLAQYPTVDKETGQMISGIFGLKKSQTSTKLVQEWADIMLANQCNNDDSPSRIPNDASFCEHRHDQSSWSLIRKTRGCVNIVDETWPGDNGETWQHEWISTKPFHARRIRG